MHAHTSPPIPYESAFVDGQQPSSLIPSVLPPSPSNVEIIAQEKPSGLPRELDDYLTVTSRPHDVFASLQDSRDRRFRLLLRRFTNQIQYGCRSAYCDAVTCLSYRKRHSTTPVRPYSDVVARALAWRCVENYADTAEEEGWLQHGVVKRKGKSKRHHVNNTNGLCWNEPVVPWYEDPTQTGRRKANATHKSTLGRQDGQLERSSRRNTDTGTGSGHGLLNSSYGAPMHPLSDALHQPANNINLELDTSKGVSELLQTHASVLRDPQAGRHRSVEASASRQRHVVFAEPLIEPISGQQPATKDTASFTQTLYDTTSVKQFDDPLHLQPSNPGTLNQSQVDDGPGLRRKDPTSEMATQPWGTATIPRVATFKLLPLSAILWLRSAIPYDEHLSPHRDLNTTIDHGMLSSFARQSLHFCMARPLLLLKSAKTWHFIGQQPYKRADSERAQIIQKLASKEKSVLQSPQEANLPQPDGIMVAFGMLIALTSIPEVLDHLFAALQHAYTLPPWFESKHSKTQSTLGHKQHLTTVYSSSHSGDSSKIKHAKQSLRDDRQTEGVFLEDAQVAQLCMVIALALHLILELRPQAFNLTRRALSKDFRDQYSQGRKSGVVFPYASLFKAWPKDFESTPSYQAYTVRLDTMDLGSFQRLADSFADMLSHRIAIAETMKASNDIGARLRKSQNVVDLFVQEILTASKASGPTIHKQSFQINMVDILRSVLLRRWNREPIVEKRGPVSGALELLAAIYRNRTDLGVSSTEFEWPFMSNTFDDIEMPVKWLDFRDDGAQTHILSYSFLFEPATLVTYFRAINSTMMKRSYDSASSVFADARQFLHNMPINVYGAKEVLSEIRPNMAKFFVLTIRRKSMLQDAINQLWRRQRQELTRPLKVRLGKDEGEDGLDHGGVQAEFFRLVFAEALDQDYGMFTLDERNRMTWFQPGSLEPLYKFEALGILMSLAIYNGITLPVTFPLAFYRKLLGLKVKTLQQIRDGWPDLANGLQQLLDWHDGDVGQVIARTYEFAYEAFGTSITVDMTKVGRDEPWPPVDRTIPKDKSKTASFNFPLVNDVSISEEDNRSEHAFRNQKTSLASPKQSGISTPLTVPSHRSSSQSVLTPDELHDEAPLVTNSNREQYVKDYIYWLTNKSVSPQFSSFTSGFLTCLDRTALSIFTPEHLKVVVEGHQHIDIDGLQATTTYDEYKSTDDIIQWFWQVVRDMSPDRHKRLLEFVTASDRVPVNGIDSVVFIIQRNGDGDDRLPSSSTCYGRLLLPRYSTREILREKLEKAVENSVGFGSL